MSSQRQLRIAEIEVNAAPTDEHIVGIFRYESEPQKGKRGSVIVLIAEIASTLYVYEQLLDVINDAIERLRPLISAVDTDPMARFEKLVQGLNQTVATFVSQEPSPIAWNRVNLFLLEVQEEHVCLTGLGRLSNLFLQRQPDGTTRVFDLFGSLEQPAEVNPEKIFSGLIFGELKTGDALFAGTQNFERLRQELEIVPRLKSLPPVTAALDIQQSLEVLRIPDDFGAVILAQVELTEPVAQLARPTLTEVPKEKSTSSVERMYAEEKTAEAMLQPTMTPLPELKKRGQAALREHVSTLGEILKGLPTRLKSFFTRPDNGQDPITLAGLRTMNAGHGSFLTRKHKLAIIGGVSILALCIGGTLWYRYAQRKNAEQLAWNNAYDQAMEQKSRAEASLVYGDDEGAQRLVQQADGILRSLDSSNEKRAVSRKLLETALASVHAKLRKEQRIDQPRSLVTLPAEAGDATLSLLGSAEGKVYTFDAKNKQFIITEAATNVVKRVDWTDGSVPVAIMTDKTGALILTQEKKAFRLDPLKATVTTVAYDGAQNQSIANATVYAKRVYLLDPTGNMIWRHNLGTSIGPGTAYLKQTSTSLLGATSLAIDSNVYVGFSNGQIVRYLSGAQETWAPTPIDPPLTNVASLWTASESDRLVIADQVSKRVVILRKDGKLVSQITSSAFQGPSAVTVDVALKQIFVTDGGSVYAFDLP